MSFGHLNDSRYERIPMAPDNTGLSTPFADANERAERLSVDLGHEKAGRNILAGKLAAVNEQLKEERGLGFKSLNNAYKELDGLPEKAMPIPDAIRSLRRQLDSARRIKNHWKDDAHRYAQDVEQRTSDLIAAKKRIGELVSWKNVHLDDADDLADANARLERIEAAIFQPYGDTRPYDVTTALDMLDLEREQHGAVMTVRNAEIERLRVTLYEAASAIESIAFEMPPPNRYTPRFAGVAVSMRDQMRPIKVAKNERAGSRTAREHYDDLMVRFEQECIETQSLRSQLTTRNAEIKGLRVVQGGVYAVGKVLGAMVRNEQDRCLILTDQAVKMLDPYVWTVFSKALKAAETVRKDQT